jgi:CoA transferase family III
MAKPLSDEPLSGIRVIDLTNVIMGPFATHILADMTGFFPSLQATLNHIYAGRLPGSHCYATFLIRRSGRWFAGPPPRFGKPEA